MKKNGGFFTALEGAKHPPKMEDIVMAAMHSRGDALMYATEASQARGFFWFPVSCGEKKSLQFGAMG